MLKTLKESERKLLFDNSVLLNYSRYLQKHPESILCKIYGVYTIKLPMVEEISIYIMDNMLGKDFANIQRIYDLKGSTKGRKAKLTKEEEDSIIPTGLKVLKDINFMEFDDKIDLSIGERRKL